MSSNAEVAVRDYDGNMVYLYTHWDGDNLPKIVANALARAKDRWNDPPYLARVIFSDMIKHDIDSINGFGISTQHTICTYPLIIVDIQTQSVYVDSIENPMSALEFKDFCDISSWRYIRR